MAIQMFNYLINSSLMFRYLYPGAPSVSLLVAAFLIFLSELSIALLSSRASLMLFLFSCFYMSNQHLNHVNDHSEIKETREIMKLKLNMKELQIELNLNKLKLMKEIIQLMKESCTRPMNLPKEICSYCLNLERSSRNVPVKSDLNLNLYYYYYYFSLILSCCLHYALLLSFENNGAP